ncbi:Serine/threonine-protein phosphatase 7 long form [Glycine soja]
MTHAQPGPIDGSLLCLQHNHILNKLVVGSVIIVRRIDFNQHLVNALVECWRPETHTFHFSHGEASIFDELLVIGANIGDVRLAYQTLLGDIPPDKYNKGKMIYSMWLRQNFQELPIDVDDVVIAQHARAHIMMLIGICLMPETSGARVHFISTSFPFSSSRSGPYKLISKDVCCCYNHGHETALNVVSANESNKHSHPCNQTYFLWTPYKTPQIRRLINNVEVYVVVCAKVPLIYFEIME